VSAVVELAGITTRLAGRIVHDDVSLAIAEGEALALLGPSGSGKSTLVRVVLGLVAPERGIVRLRGTVVTDGRRLATPPEDRRLAVVFQDLALWPHLTVAGNLRFVLRSRRCDRASVPAHIVRALDRVGLAGFQDRYPGELSGGEQQRVALARALVADPDVVLFDEPLANLDVRLKRELLPLVAELLSAGGTSALWVTHDPREAAALTQRAVVLEGGRVVQSGRWDAVCAEPATAFVQAVADTIEGR